MDRLVLNQYRHLDAEGKSSTVKVNLSNNQKQIKEENFNEVINQYNVYLDEREDCNKIRLTAQVSVVASNVLFNYITEIVKDEGSDKCECLNYTSNNITDKTMNTEDSRNYQYHCGIDIFNNHILRSKKLIPNIKSVNTADYNTIRDYLYDINGQKLLSTLYSKENKPMHMYTKKNILSFEDCIDKRLVSKNGWYGFVNRAKAQVSGDTVNRVINNESIGSFIQMYPNSTHYSILPHYNKSRGREEKNWEYCLTYPYSSTTENIPCIDKNGRLKIGFIDENGGDDSSKTIIYSTCKHGLKADDTVNLYRSTLDGTSTEFIEDAVVDSIIDDYTFAVYTISPLCSNWISIYENFSTGKYKGIFQNGKQGDKYVRQDNSYVKAVGDFINADFDGIDHIGAQNLSFAKVVNGEECKYYVRIFSRFPNFDFYDGDVTEENIYKKDAYGTRPIDKYSQPYYEKQSVLSKLAYAKNAYGDDTAQIVFTDDIDISAIKDNLGRPLTSLYLMFFKTNYGRKEWYDGDLNDEVIEYSHCFGKLNCGLVLNPNLDGEKYSYGNINVMNNIDSGYHGIYVSGINEEIKYAYDNFFLGDLCEYDINSCKENILQPIMHRFNTQQRELAKSGFKKESAFGEVKYEEIITDDYDGNFNTMVKTFDSSPTSKREGYYYNPSYEIPIRTFGNSLIKFKPKYKEIIKFTQGNDNVYTATTATENYFDMDSNVYLYDSNQRKNYKCEIVNVLDYNLVSFKIYTENGDEITDLPLDDLSIYRLYSQNAQIPSYATLATDASGQYKWREVQQNGFETLDGQIIEYPFVNGCLYINKAINIFVRRQDPFSQNGLAETNGIDVLKGTRSDKENTTDTSVKESDATC